MLRTDFYDRAPLYPHFSELIRRRSAAAPPLLARAPGAAGEAAAPDSSQ